MNERETLNRWVEHFKEVKNKYQGREETAGEPSGRKEYRDENRHNRMRRFVAHLPQKHSKITELLAKMVLLNWSNVEEMLILHMLYTCCR